MNALHTAEVRWFFSDLPLDSRDFFTAAHRADPRTDWYAFPSDTGCGIKIREGRLEAKLRSGQMGLIRFGDRITGHVEAWSKWSFEFNGSHPPESILLRTHWIPVEKVRYVRRFEVRDGVVTEVPEPRENGCSFELTEISDRDQRWWTIGFESIAASGVIPDCLYQVIRHTMGAVPSTAVLNADNSYGYPEWLQRIC
jgi:hypothetical protein